MNHTYLCGTDEINVRHAIAENAVERISSTTEHWICVQTSVHPTNINLRDSRVLSGPAAVAFVRESKQ